LENKNTQTNPFMENVPPIPPIGENFQISRNEIPPSERKFWSFWPTIGFGALIFVGWFIIQTLVTLPFLINEIINNGMPDYANIVNNLIQNSFYVALVTMISAPVGIGLIILFIKLRGKISLKEYLGLRPFKKNIFLVLLIIFVAFFILNIYLENLLPQFQNADSTIGSFTGSGLILFAVAAVIFAPIFEESFFRGFLFVGIQNSIIGVFGAIALTSITFAILHLQYGPAGILVILVLAIFLGISRWLTNSLFVTIIFHALWNLGVVVQMLFS
jgi:membrane protease YdiL (CAAX protease family)